MALSATIYKVKLTLSDLNRHHYEDYQLVMPKHPSENEQRMMWRLVCFCYCSHRDLKFTKGLSTSEEPELWQKSFSGDIVHWVEMGLPDEKRIRQALGKAERVSVFTLHPQKSKEWFEKVGSSIKHSHFHAFHLEIENEVELTDLCHKSMDLLCTIQDDRMIFSDKGAQVEVLVRSWI